MKFTHRYLFRQVISDLKEKMVLIGGPRQVGKTTLAKQILKSSKKGGYLNWDVPEDRTQIIENRWPDTKLLVLDEIHKYKKWRNMLKGLYDKYGKRKKILVTGSAKLDFYRYGGDSLQGRYHYLRFHPLSVAELGIKSQKGLLNLLSLNGFPEPFFSQSKEKTERWSNEYRRRLIQEEVAGLERTQDLGTMELMSIRIPNLVGSPLSINALREDLQVSHATVSKWLTILERIYTIFRLAPFGSPYIRAVKKEQKHYHFDWNLVLEKGARFENFTACHLLKWVQFQQDVYGKNIELRYFRDVDGREVDFIVTENETPKWAIECKWDDSPIGKGLKYLKERFPGCEMWQISAVGTKDYISDKGIRVAPAIKFLKTLL